MPLIHCPECGTQVSDQATACPKCAYPISKLNFKQAEQQPVKETIIKNNFADLDYYYQQEFEEIQKTNEEYRGKFNWWAFFFSWIWCLTKGAWGWALVLIGSTVLINIIVTSYFRGEMRMLLMIGAGIGLANYFGHNATKVYYNVKVKNKQF
jgi:hypothetical protein